MSIAKRTRRAAEIAGFIAALAASCALPSYQIEGRDETSSAGIGGRGPSGSEAASSSSQGGRGGADALDAGSDGDSGKGNTDAAVCTTGDFLQCDNPSVEGQPCSCKGTICFVDKCDLTGGGEAHGLACKPDPQNLDQLIWTALPAPLQCCPGNKRPCRSDLKEVCVQTQKPAGVACVTNPCGTGQNLDCQLCASVLCKDISTLCEVKGGIVICSPPP